MIDLDSLNQALIECVKVCGGSKVVGQALWPEKPIDASQRMLLSALNEDRPEKLSPDQAMLIMRMARERDDHSAIHFICDALGYSHPAPIPKASDQARIMKSILEAQEALAKQFAELKASSDV